MTPRAIIFGLAGAVAPVLAMAAGLELPAGAQMTSESYTPAGDYSLAVGSYDAGVIQSLATTGAITVRTWRIGASGQTTAQLIGNLRRQLANEGYEVLFTCRDEVCGGFDFRFSTTVVGEPDMHVDLGDYRYLAAQKPGAGAGEFISLLVSRSASAGFVQVIRVSAPGTLPPVGTVTSTKANGTEPQPGQAATDLAAPRIGDRLENLGHAVLADLFFATGTSDLGEDSFASLEELAAFLLDNPDLTVALVGHTDAQGTLEGNIALSKRRATSVMDRLVTAFGVPAEQMTAEGVGYLSPIASNLSEEGRMKNRRVEVILTTTRQ